MTISASAGTIRSTVLRLHHVDRSAGERARDRDLVEVLRHLLHRRVGDGRRAADHDGAGQRLLPRPALFPMRVDAGAQLDRRIHAEPPRRLELAAVVADILDAGVGVLGDVMRRRRDTARCPSPASRSEPAGHRVPGRPCPMLAERPRPPGMALRRRRHAAAAERPAPSPRFRRPGPTACRSRCGRCRGWRQDPRSARDARTRGLSNRSAW